MAFGGIAELKRPRDFDKAISRNTDCSNVKDGFACVDKFEDHMVWDAFEGRAAVLVADCDVDKAASLLGAASTAKALSRATVVMTFKYSS